MKTVFKSFVALVLAGIFALGLVGSASASPTGVSFTQDKVYVAVNEAVVYTASSSIVCDKPPCKYEWRVFGTGYSRLGTPIGTGTSLVKAWDSVGNKNVQLKVTNSYGTNGYGVWNAYTVVQ